MKWTFTCFLPVHGGWGEWSNHWSECSTTCGLGMRTRERECDNPKPKYGGRPCDEQERQQVKYCRERDCDPGLILRLLLLSFYCMFVAAFPLAEFLCFHTGIKMTIAQLAWEKEKVLYFGLCSQMRPPCESPIVFVKLTSLKWSCSGNDAKFGTERWTCQSVAVFSKVDINSKGQVNSFEDDLVRR